MDHFIQGLAGPGQVKLWVDAVRRGKVRHDFSANGRKAVLVARPELNQVENQVGREGVNDFKSGIVERVALFG
jgi:hypothetical protein